MTIRVFAATLALAVLTACGADGPPESPEPRPAPGVTVTGTAEIGLARRG